MPPSKSEAQHRFFEVVAHNPQVAKQRGVSQGVAREFLAADKAAGKFQKSTEQLAAPVPSGVTRQLASYNVGGLQDRPTQPPADQTYEFKTLV